MSNSAKMALCLLLLLTPSVAIAIVAVLRDDRDNNRQMVFQFGDVYYDPLHGAEISHAFRVRNDFLSTPISLRVVSKSCSCILSRIDETTLAPGESTFAIVTLRADPASIVRNESVVLSSGSGAHSMIRLTLKGRTIPWLSLEVPKIAIPRIELGDSFFETIKGIVYTKEKGDSSRIRVQSGDPCIHIRELVRKVKKINHGYYKTTITAQMRIDYRLSAVRQEYNTGFVFLKNGDVEIRERVAWFCRVPFQLTRQQLFFSGSTKQSKTIRVSSTDEFVVLSVECNHPLIEIEPLKVSRDRTHDICVTFCPARSSDVEWSVTGILRLRTDDSEFPAIEVPLYVLSSSDICRQPKMTHTPPP